MATASFAEPTSWSTGWFRWAGSADVTISAPGGGALAGARVELRVTPSGGSPQTVVVTTGSDGRATVPVGPYDWYYVGGTGQVAVEVVAVDVPDGTWDGAPVTTTIRAP